MTKMISQDVFDTSDSWLAGALMASGFELLRTVKGLSGICFEFKNESELESCVENYWANKAFCVLNLKHAMRRIRDEIQNANFVQKK